MTDPIRLSVLECHINDLAFSNRVLEIINGWIADGTIRAALADIQANPRRYFRFSVF